MKRPSKKTLELIRKLHGEQSFLDKRVGRQEMPLQAFDAIASSGEVLVIPYLTAFLLNRQIAVREAAARTIKRLMAGLTPVELMRLDEAFRRCWSYGWGSSEWPDLKPAAIKQLWQLPDAISIVGITSFHGSGYIRDAAAKELAGVSDGSELPFLLIRLNDWVGAVRESAAAAVWHRIRPEYAAHFLQNFQLIYRLRSCQRGRHENIMMAVTTLLQEPEAVSVLRSGILSGDSWLRRAAFQLALATQSENGLALIRETWKVADPVMRLQFARQALAHLDDDELLLVLPGLVQDRFMPVRCEALEVYARRFPKEAPAVLTDALLDPHVSVRATARYWIKAQNPESDFAGFYRKALEDACLVRKRAAILGLGETGTAADAERVLGFNDIPVVKIRKAVIRTLAALDGDRQVPRFIIALTGREPGISNEAARALAGRTGAVLDELHGLFRSRTEPHLRKNLFKLLMKLPFWTRGIFLFETLRDQDERIVEMGRSGLRIWLARSRNMPSPPGESDVRQLAAALKASSGMFSPCDIREFEFLLQTNR